MEFAFTLIFMVFLVYINIILFKQHKAKRAKKELDEFKKIASEIQKLQIASDNFLKTGKESNVIMSLKAIKYGLENNIFNESLTLQFKQILQKYPFEKEFNIEIGSFVKI